MLDVSSCQVSVVPWEYIGEFCLILYMSWWAERSQAVAMCSRCLRQVSYSLLMGTHTPASFVFLITGSPTHRLGDPSFDRIGSNVSMVGVDVNTAHDFQKYKRSGDIP